MDLLDLIRELQSGEHELYESASDEDIARTESTLERRLPSSFKAFVKTFSNGAYLYTAQEVSAVGAGNDQIAPIHSNYPIASGLKTISFREEGTARAEDLVPFSLDANGNAWCFIIDPDIPTEDPPVAYLAPMMPLPEDPEPPKLYGRLSGFEAWLSLLAERQNEVIREMYPDEVINDELKLG
jgi:hypothetical protein